MPAAVVLTDRMVVILWSKKRHATSDGDGDGVDYRTAHRVQGPLPVPPFLSVLLPFGDGHRFETGRHRF